MKGIFFTQLLSFFLLLGYTTSYAQSTLSAGDLAIIGINGNRVGDDGDFAFCLLVDIEAGTEIRFTDTGWLETSSTFQGYEGAIKYTAPKAIPAGRVISWSNDFFDFANDNDSIVGLSGLRIDDKGDQLIAFQGPSNNPIFIFAAQTNSNQWQTGDPISSHQSALPAGLANGNNAVAVGSGPAPDDEYDFAAYDSILAFNSPSEALTFFANNSRWTGNFSTPYDFTAKFGTDIPLHGEHRTPKVSNIPDQTIAEGEDFTTINLDNYIDDPDNDDSQITWTFGGNVDLGVVIDQNRVATITIPNVDWNGSEIITFRATDPDSLWDEDFARFTVEAVNDTPVVSDIPDQFIAEGGNFASINLDNFVFDPDHPDSVIVWSYNGNVELNVIFDGNRVATIGIPDSNWYGSETIIFTATDPYGFSDNDETVFTVEPENDPPQITNPLPQIIFNEDESLLYGISNWFPFVNDPELSDTQLVYSVLAENCVNAEPLNGSFHFCSPENWFGNDSLKLVVSDSILSDTASFFVQVKAVNDPPEFMNLPDSTFFAADTSALLNLWEYIEDPDQADSLLSYDFFSTSDSLHYDFDQMNGDLTLFSELTFSGIAQFVITVTDDSSAIAEDMLIIVILHPPLGIEASFSSRIPENYSISQNYPNPFNPVTHIQFGLPNPSYVKLEIFDLLGRRTATLVDARLQAGYHTVSFDGSNLPSGIYLYRIEADKFVKTNKMVLQK